MIRKRSEKRVLLKKDDGGIEISIYFHHRELRSRAEGQGQPGIIPCTAWEL
jgi:hypothetical protein